MKCSDGSFVTNRTMTKTVVRPGAENEVNMMIDPVLNFN
jgi:hypothetical protein